MTVEAVPFQTCNLGCTYCYENTMREAGNFGGPYDIDKMIKTLKEENQEFNIFGGEPLLMKFEDLKKLLEYGYKKWKKTGIQTNGTLITARHIKLFQRCNTSVGISIDGPAALNRPRQSHNCSVSDTDKLTKKTERSIERLVKSGVEVGLIITVHKMNASAAVRPRFKKWLKWLDSIPIRNARLHMLEQDHDRSIALTEEETIEAFLDLAKFEMRELKNLRFDKFQEMMSRLGNDDGQTSCIWNDCDPYTTHAVRGVNGDGSRSNCGRVNKDGVNWVKADSTSHIRQIALYNTPQEDDGCKGCRFFLACRGFCPGTAIGTDWRNRTEHCRALKALFGYYEEVLFNSRKLPISQHPDRLKMEQALISQLANPTQQHQTQHEDWYLINGVKVHRFEVK